MAQALTQENHPFILRKLAWDVLPCQEVQSALPVLGLTPASPEGAEIEHRASHDRVEALAPLEQHIMVYSALCAKVSAAHALKLTLDDTTDPQILNLVLAQFAESHHIGASVVLAQLLEQGVISINLDKL